jgi:ribulose-phosphate 3-epimerase
MEIIPAIMPKNYEDLKNKVALVRGLVPTVQIDLMDGQFVGGRTWPFEGGGITDSGDLHLSRILGEQEGMPFWEEIDYELDLMVADAVINFDTYLKLGPKRLVFHIEAVGDEAEFKDFLEGIDLYVRDNTAIGVAINTTTPIEKIFPLVDHIDFVQCMGIEKIGRQGEPFDGRVLGQIKALREKFPELIISVDGAVSLDTAGALADAGADRLVAGSAIFQGYDIRAAINELENL